MKKVFPYLIASIGWIISTYVMLFLPTVEVHAELVVFIVISLPLTLVFTLLMLEIIQNWYEGDVTGQCKTAVPLILCIGIVAAVRWMFTTETSSTLTTAFKEELQFFFWNQTINFVFVIIFTLFYSWGQHKKMISNNRAYY